MEKNNSLILYPENRELRMQLRKGDMVEIAKLSGLKISYVRNVMGGYRNNADVIAWAKRVISDRKERLEQIVNLRRESNNS